jgi:hypothetical protein
MKAQLTIDAILFKGRLRSMYLNNTGEDQCRKHYSNEVEDKPVHSRIPYWAMAVR